MLRACGGCGASGGVRTGVRSGLSQRRSAAAAGRLGGLGRQPLGISGRRFCLRVRPGRGEGRRHHLPAAPRAHRPASSPFAGVLGDRYRRELVLFASASRSASPARAGAALGVWQRRSCADRLRASRSSAIIANAPFRSAQAAITPTLARTPSELTAANAVVQHDREPRVLPWAGRGRAAARRDRPRGRLRAHRSALRDRVVPRPADQVPRRRRRRGGRGVDDPQRMPGGLPRGLAAQGAARADRAASRRRRSWRA